MIDTATDSVVATVPIAGQPDYLALSPAGDFLYVLTLNSNLFYKISTATFSVVGTPLDFSGLREARFGISGDGQRAYLPSEVDDLVYVVDTATMSVVGTFAATNIHHFAVSPDGRYAVAIDRQNDLLRLYKSSSRRPVVFLPGLLGSELWEYSLLPSPDISRRWPPHAPDELLSDLLRLLLAPDGSDLALLDIRAGDILRIPSVYDVRGLLDELAAAGYREGDNLLIFPYDWRKSNLDNANALRSEIASRWGLDTEFDLVAHSMGGLLARHLAHDPTLRVHKAIYLGTPQQGATMAYLAFLGKTRVFGLVDLDRFMSTNWPSMHELIPRPGYVDALKKPLLELRGAGVPAAEAGVPLDEVLGFSPKRDTLEQWLVVPNLFLNQIADQRMDRIERVGDWGAVEEHLIFGHGTDLGVAERLWAIRTHRRAQVNTDLYAWFGPGDGTVPWESAQAFHRGYEAIYLAQDVHHRDYFDPDHRGTVSRAVVDILAGRAVTTLPAFSQPSNILRPKGTALTALSPVELRVRNGVGAVAGVVDGQIVQEIPGSQILVFPNNHVVFVPLGEAYDVEIVGTGEGLFGLLIDHYTGAEEPWQEGVGELPVTPALQATLSVAANGSCTPLSVDYEGDGTPDAVELFAPSPVIVQHPVDAAVEVGTLWSDWIVATGDDVTFVQTSGPPAVDVALMSGSMSWTPTCSDLGIKTITYAVREPGGNEQTGSVMVHVVDTQAPALTAPPAVVAECSAASGTGVSLGKPLVNDNCPGVTTTHNAPSTFHLGETLVTWTASDASGNTTTATQIVTVVDNVAPTLSLSVSPDVLWPPNHKMVEVSPTWTVSDICDAAPNVELIGITMNEGEETLTYDPAFDATVGDGHTLDDIQVTSDGHIYLRAERAGTGTGRVYTITYRATDASGNSTTASATVTVPHDQN